MNDESTNESGRLDVILESNVEFFINIRELCVGFYVRVGICIVNVK